MRQGQARVCESTRSSKLSIVFVCFMVASTRSLYLLLSFGRFVTAHNKQEKLVTMKEKDKHRSTKGLAKE